MDSLIASEAICSKRCPEKFQGCFIRQDFETGLIEVPGCIKEYLSNLPDQHPPEAQKTLDINEKTTFPAKRSPPADNYNTAIVTEKTLSPSEHSTNKNEHSKKQKSSFLEIPLEPSQLKLTKTEKEYIRLISQGITDTNKLAKLRKCSRRMVQRHIKNLRQKGAIDNFNEIVRDMEVRDMEGYSEHSERSQTVLPKESDPVQQPAKGGAVPKRLIRYAGHQLWIKILDKDERYKSKISNSINVLGNTVLCRRDVIEIYSNTSFTGYDIDEITAQSLRYWRRVIAIIENDLKITLMKERAQNIKFVKNGEYAEVGNELAKICIDAGERIRVIDEKDGLWFLTDASFRKAEAETVQPQTSKEDMQEVVQPFFNDLRKNRPPLPSETWEIVHQIGMGLSTLIALQLPKEPNENHSPREKSKSSDLGGMYG